MATGNGNASKEQCQNATATLGLKELPKNLDSTDGLQQLSFFLI
jgi:crossover junction endodeoxyribonuclease RuvC